MNSPKNYLIVLLAVTTVGGALIAWRQYSDLVELRAAAMKKDERADLQKRIWNLEKLNRALRDQVAGQRGPNGEIDGFAVVAEGDRPPREGRGPGGRGDPRRDGFGQQFSALQNLMAKPEVQALVNLQQQTAIDGRYAALFKSLNLQPDQVDRLKTLLAERSTTIMDVMSAARDQGIDPRQNSDAFRKLLGDAQNEINNSIKGVIGEAGFAQLTNYEQTQPQRNLVNQLEQRLSYTNAPLTSSQSEQLVQILASTAPARPATGDFPQPPDGRGPGGLGGGTPPGRGPDIGGMIMGVLGPGAAPMVGMLETSRGGPSATVTPAAITQAQAILAPTQLQALQQIQQQQQSQQQLRQMVTDTLATQPQPTGGSNAPPPPRKRPGGE